MKPIIVPFNNPGEYEKYIDKSLFENKDGLLILIPKDLKMDKPIEIALELEESKPDNLQIVAEENTKATIIELAKSDKIKNRTQTLKIDVKNNSNLEFISIQNLNKEATNNCTKKATVAKDATLNWLDCTLGSKNTTSTINTELNEQGASTKNITLFFGNEQQDYNFDVKTVHNSPYTKSNMLSRGVLTEKAKSNYNGLVKIQENAHNTEGYQKQETLLLSDEAKADAVPNLEIHNDNVKCSHGTTISKINPEKIFYLMSRGMTEQAARSQIVAGFFESLIDKEAVREKVMEGVKC